jgi:hypothetical protein
MLSLYHVRAVPSRYMAVNTTRSESNALPTYLFTWNQRSKVVNHLSNVSVSYAPLERCGSSTLGAFTPPLVSASRLRCLSISE